MKLAPPTNVLCDPLNSFFMLKSVFGLNTLHSGCHSGSDNHLVSFHAPMKTTNLCTGWYTHHVVCSLLFSSEGFKFLCYLPVLGLARHHTTLSSFMTFMFFGLKLLKSVGLDFTFKTDLLHLCLGFVWL